MSTINGKEMTATDKVVECQSKMSYGIRRVFATCAPVRVHIVRVYNLIAFYIYYLSMVLFVGAPYLP